MASNSQVTKKSSGSVKLGFVKVISLSASVLSTLVLLFILRTNSKHLGIDLPSSASAELQVVNDNEIRIATLLPFAADQLIAMGYSPVCVPKMSGEKPLEWQGIATVQLDHSLGPNLEELIAVSPDYIITGSTYAQFMPQIESITKSKIVYMDVDSIASVRNHIQTLSQIIGRPDQGNELIESINADIGSTAYSGKRPRVLALFGTPASFYAFLPSSYLGDLINHSGGELGPSELTSHKVYKGLSALSMEMVLDFDPDILFVLFHGPVETSRLLFENDPLWSSIDSVKNNRMYFLEDNRYVMRPGSDLDNSIAEIKGYINNFTETSLSN